MMIGHQPEKSNDHPSIVYDSSLIIQQSDSIDLLILEYSIAKCFELIAYSPSLDFEAPRIYLDQQLLNQKIIQKIKNIGGNFNDPGLKHTHLVSYITSHLVVPENFVKQRFMVSLAANSDEDVIADGNTNRLDIVYKSIPAKLTTPYETYRPRCHDLRQAGGLHGHASKNDLFLASEEKAESTVECFMNYHYETCCMESSSVVAPAASSGKSDSDGSSTGGGPVNHVNTIKNTLRRAPTLKHILEVEQQHLLGRQHTRSSLQATGNDDESRLHSLATGCIKTFRKSFLRASGSNKAPGGVTFDPSSCGGEAAAGSKLEWLKMFWNNVDMHPDCVDKSSPQAAAASHGPEHLKRTGTFSALLHSNTQRELLSALNTRDSDSSGYTDHSTSGSSGGSKSLNSSHSSGLSFASVAGAGAGGDHSQPQCAPQQQALTGKASGGIAHRGDSSLMFHSSAPTSLPPFFNKSPKHATSSNDEWLSNYRSQNNTADGCDPNLISGGPLFTLNSVPPSPIGTPDKIRSTSTKSSPDKGGSTSAKNITPRVTPRSLAPLTYLAKTSSSEGSTPRSGAATRSSSVYDIPAVTPVVTPRMDGIRDSFQKQGSEGGGSGTSQRLLPPLMDGIASPPRVEKVNNYLSADANNEDDDGVGTPSSEKTMMIGSSNKFSAVRGLPSKSSSSSVEEDAV